MFVYVGAITAAYNEPKPPLYLRPEALPREGNMGEDNVGISVFDLDTGSGALTQIQAVRGLRNPSFLALHPTLPLLYAAERETTTWGPVEALAGQITRLAIASDGQLTLAERVPVGAGATYISVHPRGRHVLAAMPAPHCLSVHPLGQDGRVEPVSTLVQLHGRGVNTITLERPFPHSIRPDASGKRVLACDMGLDRVMVYDLDEQTGRLEPSPHSFAQLSSGSGPRHLAIHANNRWVYTVNELDSTVSAFNYDADSAAMRIISTTSTRPEGFSGHNSGAQIVIHPSGRFLYSSNRGHNSIATFVLDVDTGQPRLTGLVPSQGQTPRNFNVDPTGEFLIVANVGSSNIASFRIDPTSGQLSATGHSVACPNPVCVMFR